MELTIRIVDRTKSSRMGWSDISISLAGPIVSSLLIHFADRWYDVPSSPLEITILLYGRLTKLWQELHIQR